MRRHMIYTWNYPVAKRNNLSEIRATDGQTGRKTLVIIAPRYSYTEKKVLCAARSDLMLAMQSNQYQILTYNHD